MFVQVIQGRVGDVEGVRSELDRWREELQPGAVGWLGSTAGITDDGRFVVLARFESEELARRNSDRPEQGAWWEAMSRHVTEVEFHDSARVHTYRGGGSDDAGFVQVIQGHTDQMERLAELGRAAEADLPEQAPHLLGMTVAEHADRPGDFTQAVYFTNEQDARAFERRHPAETQPEILALMRDLRYYDLRDPWLDSPG